MKRNIRLKGTIYEEGFQALAQRAHLIKDRQEDYERTNESRGNRDLRTWTKGMEIKQEYHQKLYGDIKAPEPLWLDIVAIPLDNQPHITISETETLISKQSYIPHPR